VDFSYNDGVTFNRRAVVSTRRIAIVALLTLIVAIPASAQQPDPAAFVRDLYLRYAGVEPTRQMIDFWVTEMRKGVQANDVIANVLGSDQAFTRSKRNADVWLNSLYIDLLGRQPEAGALTHWQARLRELRGDRVKLAKEFLHSAGAELAQGAARPPVNRPEELPAMLQTATQLMQQAAQTECPGRDGWMLREQARTITTATSQSMTVLIRPDLNPKAYVETLTSLDQSLTAFRTALAQSRLSAPSTRLHAEQAAQIVAAMAANAGIVPPPGPGGLPGGLSRADARRLAPYATEVSREATAANATFRAVLRSNWNTTGVLKQVEAFAAEADALRSDIRAGYPVTDLLRRTQALNQTANVITTVVTQPGTDVRVYQSWYTATAAMNAFTKEVGGGGIGEPGIRSPLPGGVMVPREAFVAIDRASAECDALIAGFTPYTFYNRPSARLISDLQDLKNKYADLRRTAASSPNRRDLKAHLDGIADRMRSASGNWREADRDPRLRNPPDLNDLTAADRDVARYISAAK
jgi:hypothetical protein